MTSFAFSRTTLAGIARDVASQQLRGAVYGAGPASDRGRAQRPPDPCPGYIRHPSANLNWMTHVADTRLVQLAAAHRVPVICHKPMAPTLVEAERMVKATGDAAVPFFVHENWRWQTPIRQLQQVLSEGQIGQPFRARIDMISGFPVFVNQPLLKDLEQFILTDLGSHILDVARLLFGEAQSLYCQTRRIHRDIKGEDVATVMLRMGEDVTVLCEMAYAGNALEHDRFPETSVFVEGERGSVELGPDYWIRVTTESGTHARRYRPPRYARPALPTAAVRVG